MYLVEGKHILQRALYLSGISSNDGAPPTNKDGVPRIVTTNRQLTQQLTQQQLKEAESIEELDVMDEEDEFEGVNI